MIFKANGKNFLKFELLLCLRDFSYMNLFLKLSCKYKYIFLYNIDKMIQYADFCFGPYLYLLILKLAHSKSVWGEPKNIKEQKKKKPNNSTYIQLPRHLLFCHFLF